MLMNIYINRLIKLFLLTLVNKIRLEYLKIKVI